MSKVRVAVIGSGFGGLACAIRLQSDGFETVLFEKRDKPGGRAYVYNDQGFTFDAGPTVITAPPCLEELFQISGRRMEDYVRLLPVDPFYRLFWQDGTTFDYFNDAAKLFDQIRKMSPADVDGYKRFAAYSKEVFKEGYEKLADKPFLNFWNMIRVAPQLVRLSAHRSVYDTVAKYIGHPHLREAFSFHSLLVGGNPFTASSIYTLIHCLERKWGVSFPKGGTGALVKALVRLFTELGGDIRLGNPIEKIVTHEGVVTGVQTQEGRIETFSAVVSNADVVHTYNSLLAHEPLAVAPAKKVKTMSHSMSLFLIYFGTKKKYPDLAHHNVIFGPRYKELLSDIFDKGVLADDFSLYLHAPTVSDPTLAPEGCEAFYVLSPVPHLGKSTVDWKSTGERYARKILDYLDARHLPGLKENLVAKRIFTPEDFKTELNAHWGSAFSIEPLLTQSAYFRTHNRDARIKGLYFVGAGTHPGAGIPGVVNSAKATAGLVIADFKPSSPDNRVKVMKWEKSQIPNSKSELDWATAECRRMITKGSKSFSLAARIFDKETRDAAFCLYGWCRYCDDQIDSAECGVRNAELRLENLKQLTRNLQSSRHPGMSQAGITKENPHVVVREPGLQIAGMTTHEPDQLHAVFIAFRHVMQEYRIPQDYALDLLEGMAMDVRRERYETLDELLLYCYRVAGTVGLMMTHIMGLSNGKALKNACDMGMAMQLTNIARDVKEDFEMGRVYLPLAWLREEGISAGRLLDSSHLAGLARIVRKLLDEAEKLYRSGDAGISYLPFRAACAIAAARCVYSEIGNRVGFRGEQAWETRTVVPLPRKLYVMGRGLRQAVALLPSRIAQPWKPESINTVWRFS